MQFTQAKVKVEMIGSGSVADRLEEVIPMEWVLSASAPFH